MRIAVVGGGITGLAVAYEILYHSATRAEVVVYEESNRLGGRIETVEMGGAPVDAGADSFITRRRAAIDLCEELGLGADLVAPAVSGALVYARGELRPLPRGTVLGVPTDLRALARSGILSPRGVLRVASDLVLPRRHDSSGGDDPSVAEVLQPRIGHEAMSYLVDPLIGGINAGTSANLSMHSVAPQIAAAVAGKRSVVRSLRATMERTPGTQPLFAGINGGLGTLVSELQTRLVAAHAEVELRNPISRLDVDAGERGYVLEHGRGTDRVDGVVLCVPASVGAGLLRDVAPRAADQLERVRSASVALVTLRFPSFGLPGGGTGILVPRPVRETVTAITFTSAKWPASSPAGDVVVRASAGSIDDERHLELGDSDLVEGVRKDLGRVAGITARPVEVLVKRFPDSFPQYEPGHSARIAAARAGLRERPGVAIAGAACDGIGIPACIDSGRHQAAEILRDLAQADTSPSRSKA